MHDPNVTLRVAVVDSHGEEAIHPRFKEALSHATFHGVTPPSLRDVPLHGHGGWCAWDWASQSTQPIELLFVRVFDNNGRKNASEEFEFRAIADFKPHYINYSSGATRGSAYQESYLRNYYGPRWQDKWLESIGDALAFFSAGNSSRYEYSYPQKLLVAHPQAKIIAACQPDGHVASFSSTDTWDERYVDSAYLGVGSKSLDARTGKVVTWQGTSSSCPHAGGDICAKRFSTGKEVDEYWTSLGGKGYYNAEVGLGVCEGGRQDNMKETGLGLGTKIMHGPGLHIAVEDQPAFHDFERID